MDRRDFLKSSGTALAAAALEPNSVAAAVVDHEDGDKLKFVGLLKTGKHYDRELHQQRPQHLRRS